MNSAPPDPSSPHISGLHSACLGLGSNSDPVLNLQAAVKELGESLTIDAVSGAWQSPAHGCEAPDYVNAALLVRTTLSKDELHLLLKRIEHDLGRQPNPSLLVAIDIDLLIFDGTVLRPDLWNLAYRAVTVGELLPELRNEETSEPLVVASRRLAATTRIVPRPDIL